jgi:hypothetical protein
MMSELSSGEKIASSKIAFTPLVFEFYFLFSVSLRWWWQ